MDRLISADNLKELCEIMDDKSPSPIWKQFQSMIDFVPTIDAEPVRHGRWIFEPKDAIEMMFTLPKCSECGTESSDGGNYCSNCGAKMDKEEQNEST